MSVWGWVSGLSLMGLHSPLVREPFERSLIPSRQQDDGRLPETSTKTYVPHDMRFSLQVKNKIVSNKNDSPYKILYAILWDGKLMPGNGVASTSNDSTSGWYSRIYCKFPPKNASSEVLEQAYNFHLFVFLLCPLIPAPNHQFQESH